MVINTIQKTVLKFLKAHVKVVIYHICIILVYYDGKFEVKLWIMLGAWEKNHVLEHRPRRRLKFSRGLFLYTGGICLFPMSKDSLTILVY